ncbi:MAG: hypothetical protein NTV94_07225 [Planctomycetota bacterium]|nr:hypothetical protein [Planctomycetota bacterium]
MKYTILGILLTAGLLLIWSMRTGTAQDGIMMAVAIVSVIFFSSIDSLWNALYSKKGKTIKPPQADGVNVIVVRASDDSNQSASNDGVGSKGQSTR